MLMRVNFILPNLNLRGGIRMVRDYARALRRSGHEVTLTYPTRLRPLPLGLSRVEFLWRRFATRKKNRWCLGEVEVLPVPTLEDHHIPDADLVVATAWQTAPFVAGYPRRKGAKVYYIQDIETSKHPDDARATYRLDLYRIATSGWIATRLKEDHGSEAHAVIPYGLDLDLYRPGEPVEDPIVGLHFSADPRKGTAHGLEALERARERCPGLRGLAMGSVRVRPKLPVWVEGEWDVIPEETPGVYRRCRIWLAPSLQEGWGLPPLEAMACGAVVITTRVGGTPYFARDGETALLVPPADPGSMATAITDLFGDPARCLRLRNAGTAQAARMPFTESARKLEAALAEAARTDHPEARPRASTGRTGAPPDTT